MEFVTDNHSEDNNDWEAALAAVDHMMMSDDVSSIDDNEHLEAGAVVLSIEEVSYDRDVKWMNVPTAERRRGQGGQGGLRIRSGHGLVRQMNDITSSNTNELESLDRHYRDLDRRKIDHDASHTRPRRRNNNKKKFVRKQSDTGVNIEYTRGQQEYPTRAVQLLSRPAPVYTSSSDGALRVEAPEYVPSLRVTAPEFVPSWNNRQAEDGNMISAASIRSDEAMLKGSMRHDDDQHLEMPSFTQQSA